MKKILPEHPSDSLLRFDESKNIDSWNMGEMKEIPDEFTHKILPWQPTDSLIESGPGSFDANGFFSPKDESLEISFEKGVQTEFERIATAAASGDFPGVSPNFSYMNLSGVRVQGHDLRKADFEECGLRGVDFSGMDLRETSFFFADCEGANFRGADLRGAVFRKANVKSADFTGANLEGAKFGEAENLNHLGSEFQGALLNNTYLDLTNTEE